MRLRLESITRENIGDVRAIGKGSTSLYFMLPHDDDSTRRFLTSAEGWREGGFGDRYAAYDASGEHGVVSGGDITVEKDAISIGYWVVSAFRGRKLGKATIQLLELEALARFPERDMYIAHIDPYNVDSQHLAEAAGYTCTDDEMSHSFMVYRKPLETVLAACAIPEAVSQPEYSL